MRDIAKQVLLPGMNRFILLLVFGLLEIVMIGTGEPFEPFLSVSMLLVWYLYHKISLESILEEEDYFRGLEFLVAFISYGFLKFVGIIFKLMTMYISMSL